MTISIERRLSVALSALVILVGAGTAIGAYWVALDEAHEQQDEQLRQIALLLSNGDRASTLSLIPVTDDEDDEIRIGRPGSSYAMGTHGAIMEFPVHLEPGYSTLWMGKRDWRVYTEYGDSGPPLAIAQRISVRDEIAKRTARRAVIPMLVLFPALLLLIHLIVRRAFRPLQKLAAKLDGNPELALAPLVTEVPREILPFIEKMDQALAALQAMLLARKRFVADAAHELRSPMTALVVQVQNLEHVSLSEEARERLHSLKSGLLRACQLLEQLLSLARLQEEGQWDSEAHEFRHIVHEVLEDLMPMALDRGVAIHVTRLEAGSIVGARLSGYKLVRNLVDNAIQYSPRGSTVEVELAAEKGALHLSICDDGPGIASNDLVHVFEPFFRSSVQTDGAGTGLGLAIVAAAAKQLGGTVKLSNRAPHGLSALYIQPGVAEATAV